MQIVKNIGNYEMARLQATYELADGEGDTREAMADLFREARKTLIMLSGRTANNPIIDKEVVRGLKRMRLTYDKVDSTKRQRELDALKNGERRIT